MVAVNLEKDGEWSIIQHERFTIQSRLLTDLFIPRKNANEFKTPGKERPQSTLLLCLFFLCVKFS